ncbi:MAG: thiamine-phosphate kinase [Candidatus Thiodiazotropha sp.]
MQDSPLQSEFDLIRRHFAGMTPPRPDVSLGIGDDAALVTPPSGQQLAISVDTLVSGVHFQPSVSPQALGHKALAVNLSDLAAMGAEPAWATLALTLPEPDEAWLVGFAEGFASLARRYGVALVGGDTTRGALSLTVQVHGFVPDGQSLRRSGARVGDGIYVTGCLGDAALCLKQLQTATPPTAIPDSLRQRLDRPEPRIEAGLALRQRASSAIDISDGLLADLGHILEASDVGACLFLERLPLSAAFSEWFAASGDWSPALSGGDDYELCFTLPPAQEREMTGLAAELELGIHRIGTIEAAPGLRVLQPDGRAWLGTGRGFDHFAGGSTDAG